MSDGVHLLVPFAACSAAECAEAAGRLELPYLRMLLGRMKLVASIEGEPDSLSMPHERALALALGIGADDGLIPFAAWQARQAGLEPSEAAWARVTPCHWRVGSDHVRMAYPQELQLDADDSRAVLAAMQPYFAEDGIELAYDAPLLWLARGELFRGLPTASLDRVVGRTIEHWLPRGDAGRPLRRLQQEMQMLLYTLPLNDERQRGGLLPVNSFWVSGTGTLAPPDQWRPDPGVQVSPYLRDAALQGDWAAWAAAWRELDARDGARLANALERGATVRVTLCGERHARTWSSEGVSWWQRTSARWSPPSVARVLETLS